MILLLSVVTSCLNVYQTKSKNFVFFVSRYLMNLSVIPRLFNSYGSRRGNDAVMARGTFANIRLVNKLAGKTGPQTLHIPSGAYPIKHFFYH